ncbi:MAG: hypothetical protein HY563_04905 [Ignavibacteriales bacterium]|nr:hypothetical protein [Ignavibacteriales bacterium]
MDPSIVIFLFLLLYAAGIILVIRFASFMHNCDDDVQSMIRNPKPPGRTKRQKPQYRTA